MMKKAYKLINKITFDQARKNMNKQSIQREFVGKENFLLSYSVKSKLLFISVFIIPIVFFLAMLSYDMDKIPKEGYSIFVMISSLFVAIVLLSMYIYYRITQRNSFPFLNRFKYRLLLFILSEISVAGYSSFFIFGHSEKNTPILLVGIIIAYVFLVNELIKVIINTRVYETLNKTYGSNLEIKKWKQYLSRFPALLLLVSFFCMQAYRMSKSLFIFNNIESPRSIIYPIIGDVGFVIIAISISLLPTVFFDSETFIRGSLLKKYSEKFREEYGFTKKEWYGE